MSFEILSIFMLQHIQFFCVGAELAGCGSVDFGVSGATLHTDSSAAAAVGLCQVFASIIATAFSAEQWNTGPAVESAWWWSNGMHSLHPSIQLIWALWTPIDATIQSLAQIDLHFLLSNRFPLLASQIMYREIAPHTTPEMPRRDVRKKYKAAWPHDH